MQVDSVFLAYSGAKLTQYAERIAACLDLLTEEQIWARPCGSGNAIGNLVLHLCGNLRQWIGYGVAGQADVRERDGEFAAEGGLGREELKKRIRDAVAGAVEVTGGLTEERLLEPVCVQGYIVTVLEAVYHVTEHFSHHTGQIIFATKMWTDEDLGFYRHLAQAAHSEKVP
jgi:uncharacterized damage-inducible protein DinB